MRDDCVVKLFTSGVLVATPDAFELARDLRVAEKLESEANEGCTERTTSLERYAMRAAVIRSQC